MPLFADAVYLLCLGTSLACMGLLYRGYRRSGMRLLLWSTLCFVFLSLNNLLLYLDIVLLPGADLQLYRLAANLVAVSLLLFGFIWESD